MAYRVHKLQAVVESRQNYIRFDFLTVVTLKITVFWVVMRRSLTFTDVSEEPAASTINGVDFLEMSVHFQQTTLSHIQQQSILRVFIFFCTTAYF